MRKPGNYHTDDKPLVSTSCPISSRRLGHTVTGCSLSGQRDSHEDNRSSPRNPQKLGDSSTAFNFHHQNIMMPSCGCSNKVPALINFDFKQNSAIRNRKMEIPGISALLDGIHNSRGINHRLEAIIGNSTTSSRIKETTKHTKKEALDSCRCNQGSCSQHQDGTYSLTTLKEQEASTSQSNEYTEKLAKKQSKIHKTRHSSKSIAMNLNDMIVGGKKSKTKRPLTCSSPELNSDGSILCSPKISTRIFSGANKGSRKDKENLPPILRPGQHQTPGCSGQNEDSCQIGCNKKNCLKCSAMAQKLKAQVQVAKTLQRQNGCLENIVTQKRNLVEQLTRQVRTLVRENQQLSKGCGSSPLETMLSTEGTSAPPPQNIPTLSVLGCSGSPVPYQMENYRDVDVAHENFEDTRKAHESNEEPKKSESTEKLKEAEQQLSTLNVKCEAMQHKHDHLQKENQEINRFLTDLLYTLNARGYESITDYEGNTIDLYRCKGDTFLDLKGRDARLRTPAKRLAPQETLLKAVIGSQERIIQNLISQLEDHQKNSMLEKRLSLSNFSGEEDSRSAKIEGEVLALVGLLEGACQRNPEVLTLLKDQYVFDSQVKAHSGLEMKSTIVEAVFERCQKVISSLPSPLAAKRRPRDYLHPRIGTPPPYQSKFGNNTSDTRGRIPIYSESQTLTCPHPENKEQHHSTCLPNVNSGKNVANTCKSDNNSLSPDMGLQPHQQQLLFEIPVRNRLPQLSRSSTHNNIMGPLGPVRTNSSMILANGISPRGSPPTRLRSNLPDNRVGQPVATGATSTLVHITPIPKLVENTNSCLNGDRCPYCSRQFSSTTSLAEINAHMEMHAYQSG